MNALVLPVMILGAVVACCVASGKNRNAIGWAVFGALFPLIAVVAVCCLPRRILDEERR